MSVFTTVTAAQLDAWLSNYSVGTLVRLEGIPAGIENTNYFVTTTQGRYVLTLFEKLKLHELPFYLNLMAHLSSHGIPSPRPIANRDNELLGELNGKPAALVTFLAGKDLADPQPDHCVQVGATLANMHLAGTSYPLRMDNPRGPKWWKAVMPEIVPFLAPEEAALLREEVRFQSLYRFSDLPRGAIHADLFRDNVLFDRRRITGVIDFYFACTDALLFDVAITINDWCMKNDGRLDPVRAAALLEAYRAIRPFTAIERGAWPVMLRAAALRFWVSRLYDFYLPRPGELTHAKDPGHFRRILMQHIANEYDLPQLAL
ncbi:MAG: homoserine kinase [Betaproteobacteria bacterium RIFCSPLOWO2_12_FULL_62_13]|nr:MAG: homoserine kinase [Betaproteobacteria bacterium RIFCSPLOWO2_12_FULL_62_13]